MGGPGWEAVGRARGVAYLFMLPIDDERRVPARVLPSELKRLHAMEKGGAQSRLRDGSFYLTTHHANGRSARSQPVDAGRAPAVAGGAS